jgi:DNA invertase Pin-like site-specific DNA recombinase
MKRYQKPKPTNKQTRNPWDTPTIPQDAKVGVYSRQSTLNQVKHMTQSAEMQTDDLIVVAMRMGVREENIILYLENIREDGTMKSASGRLRIDQREGLSALVERIETDEIKAVIVFMEDRLFRDETQIEVNKFILICKEHDTLVITPHMTYDFSNPYHVKQFRWKCEQAADFLREYIRERLHAAKAKASSKGIYDGRPLTVGYIIDRRETINGEPNPKYKHFMIYEPHAKVVRRIFQRYVELGGRTRKLFRELLKIPVLFPDFDPQVDPRTVARLGLKKVPEGYHISFTGLKSLLTNVSYIGWWIHHDTIVRDNHPAIIEEDVFWYAFNQISDTTPTGDVNIREHAPKRYTHKDKQEPLILLKEIITTSDKRAAVYATYTFSDWYYLIKWKDVYDVTDIYSVLASHVDEAFKTTLYTHMENTRDFEHFRTLVEQTKKDAEKEEEDRVKNIARVERRMKATLLSLTTDENLPKKTRNALEQIYAELVEEREVLLTQPIKPTLESRVANLLSYHNLLERLKKEEELHFEDLKLLSQATTRSVTLDGLSPHFMRLTIVWRTPIWGTDTALLWRPCGRAPVWTEEEKAIIKTHYPKTSQEELLHLLPLRSWQSINQKAYRMGIPREKRSSLETGMDGLSLDDRKVMQHYGLTLEELSSDNQIIWLMHTV